MSRRQGSAWGLAIVLRAHDLGDDLDVIHDPWTVVAGGGMGNSQLHEALCRLSRTHVPNESAHLVQDHDMGDESEAVSDHTGEWLRKSHKGRPAVHSSAVSLVKEHLLVLIGDPVVEHHLAHTRVLLKRPHLQL